MPADGPITRLHIADDRITLEIADNLTKATTLDIGSLRSILDCLRHEPVKADEIETAIAQIEDALMPAMPALPTRRQLITSAPGIWKIAGVAGFEGSAPARLSTETVEMLFNQLVDVAYGTPAARLGIPSDRGFVANLLLLRELLHHGSFGSIMILP